jgi:hypothetical protein
MTHWKIASAAAFALMFAGCGGTAATPTGQVKGKVTLDGKPLAAGRITFDAANGTSPIDLEIKDGEYNGKVPTGPKTVRVQAFKLVDPPKGMTGPAYEKPTEQNYLPARYNIASKDIRDVKDGTNEFDIAVTSK